METGQLLYNRYRIVEILGKGGMGAVYRAVDESLGVSVAVKENLFDDDEYTRQFRREAVILANLRHPNLPRVTDHFVIENQGQYLVMDYIEGEDLRQRTDRMGTLPENEVAAIGVSVCDALEYLHTLDPVVIHRDIKPGNVKVTPGGEVFLVDFGLAKVIEGSQQTTTGAQGVTPGFSPPEQYGSARTDARTDIYSLGATLYAVFTGVPPEDGLARAMHQTQLTKLRDISRKVSRQLANAIEKSLEIQPDDRYQTAGEFGQALLRDKDTVRRQFDAGTITITPPPPDTSGDATRVAGSGVARPTFRRPTTQPPQRRGGGRSRFMSCLMLLVLAVVLIAGGLAGAYYFVPGVPDQVAMLLNGPPTAPPVVEQPTFTATVFFPEETPEIIEEVTQAPPTETPTEEVTEVPTDEPVAGPTPVGGGQQIAFASDRSGQPQIWVMNLDGSDLRQITDEPSGACQPDWSPDSSRIVFTSPCNRYQEVYTGSSLFLVTLETLAIEPLPSAPGGDYDPAWSPDGNQIAFTTLRQSNRPNVWIHDLVENRSFSVTQGVTTAFMPVWSPDGETLLFVTTRIGPTQIWFMDKDGSDPNIFSRSDTRKNIDPAWSPLGELIAWSQSSPSGGAPPWLQAASWEGGAPERGFNESRVTENDLAPMRDPDFSPDGAWLVFEGYPDGVNHDIFIMTPSGASLQRLTEDPAFDFDPAWSGMGP